MKSTLLNTFFLSLIFSINSIAQTNYYVKADGSNANDGLTEASAFSTVSNAVVAASNGDKIIVVGTINQSGQVAITKTLTLEGQSDGELVSTGTTRMYDISTPGLAVTFKNITFKNANASVQGAVVNLTGNSDLTIDGCTFENNTTTNNGGVILAGATGTLSITNSLFNGNSATRGGAISVTATGRKLTINSSTFVNNSATNDGGAMYLGGGNTQSSITNTTIYSNSVVNSINQSKGGGIRIEVARPFTIENSLIYDNYATDGSTNSSSDIGIVAAVNLTLTNSLSKKIEPALDDTAGDAFSTSKVEADLTTSNLRFDVTLGKVIYDAVAQGTDSPIGFGSDGNDVGSWNSGLSLTLGIDSIEPNSFYMSYNKLSKSLQIKYPNDEAANIEIFNTLGAKVLTAKNIQNNNSVDVSTLKSGLYIVVCEISKNYFAKKLFIF